MNAVVPCLLAVLLALGCGATQPKLEATEVQVDAATGAVVPIEQETPAQQKTEKP